MQNLTTKVCESLTNRLLSSIDASQTEIEIIKTKWLMENHMQMDWEMWNRLNLKMSVLDIDLAESDLVMLAEYESLPYQKTNPVLLTHKLGNNPMRDEDTIPSYIYVMESLQFDQPDF